MAACGRGVGTVVGGVHGAAVHDPVDRSSVRRLEGVCTRGNAETTSWSPGTRRIHTLGTRVGGGRRRNTRPSRTALPSRRKRCGSWRAILGRRHRAVAVRTIASVRLKGKSRPGVGGHDQGRGPSAKIVPHTTKGRADGADAGDAGCRQGLGVSSYRARCTASG